MTRGVAWLVILALLGLGAMPVSLPDGLALAAYAPAEPGLICTEHGPQPAAPQPGNETAPAHDGGHQQSCPFCVAHAGGSLAPPAAPQPDRPAGGTARAQSVVALILPALADFRIGHPPRAPPESV